MWGGTPSIWSSYFFQCWSPRGLAVNCELEAEVWYCSPLTLTHPRYTPITYLNLFHLPFLLGALFSLFFWFDLRYLSRLENVEKRALGATESGLGSNMNLTTTPLDTHPTHTLFLSHHTPHHHHNTISLLYYTFGCALLQILDMNLSAFSQLYSPLTHSPPHMNQ